MSGLEENMLTAGPCVGNVCCGCSFMLSDVPQREEYAY